jgi:hypothetical protein
VGVKQVDNQNGKGSILFKQSYLKQTSKILSIGFNQSLRLEKGEGRGGDIALIDITVKGCPPDSRGEQTPSIDRSSHSFLPIIIITVITRHTNISTADHIYKDSQQVSQIQLSPHSHGVKPTGDLSASNAFKISS